ncbi:phosphoribosyl-AMP cyclohydrolase [[Leptolyngbya] sp. PCC 7376]|uniref:bifunctional phosphoribosyl-AMP cyclohydrolase/phosphoribosyl-ATP diphosphatase HisIE n=1 Tax=[Leptolyngbya] sp. PCC 7376 TaxID=111781 RepID=UPI00029EEA1D|nr:bifunctional phosphoribosyl-AMP cyclohydrolase/phosphoribosyl-ATP diphosphatase HisIE [[Leptolyngbya] sp. PCC 7376]AFY38963.1 phosphoribosyl-AMP cyclohydrolase [[Leptolyngbya] sp. PCC 7376]
MSLVGAIPLDKVRFNEQGLVPAIAQDYLDGTVLMMAWMNKESLTKTMETGQGWYWSRSRQELWHKGATSGHFQNVKALRYDCDSDAILMTIEQVGDIACHKGRRSCFHQIGSDESAPSADTLSEVFNVIRDRRDNPQEGSYTNSLLAAGDNKILKKIGEEAAEVVMACKDDEKDEIAGEVADLFYHSLVAIAHHNVDLRDVYKKLDSRRR